MLRLVTGAGGFIGGHIGARLQLQKNVVATDIKLKPDFRSRTEVGEWVTQDLRNTEESIERLSVFGEYDEVYHLAADMGGMGFIGGGHDAEILANNLRITITVLELCRSQRKKPKLFYSSSACVYPAAAQSSELLPELSEETAYPADPDSDYGWEKLTGERLVAAYARDHGIDPRIARFHNVYGPYGAYAGGREKAPAALCRKFASKRGESVVSVWGDGEQRRSFLYIDDCLDAVMRLMRSPYTLPVNIGSERAVTIRELAELTREISGTSKTIVFDDPSGPQGVRSRTSHNRVIEAQTGWRESTTLEDGMRRTYEWIKSQMYPEARR